LNILGKQIRSLSVLYSEVQKVNTLSITGPIAFENETSNVSIVFTLELLNAPQSFHTKYTYTIIIPHYTKFRKA